MPSTHQYKVEEAPDLTVRIYVKQGIKFLRSDTGALENYNLANIGLYAFSAVDADGTGAYLAEVTDPLVAGTYEFFYCYGTGPSANAGDFREKRFFFSAYWDGSNWQGGESDYIISESYRRLGQINGRLAVIPARFINPA